MAPHTASAPRNGAKPKKVKSIKNQIRSLERVLKNSVSALMTGSNWLAKLTDWVELFEQNVTEEAKNKVRENIRMLHKKRKDNEELQEKKVMHLRYKRIRLFERRKLLRNKERIEKSLQDVNISEEDREKLNEELKSVEDDLVYVINFPFGMKYVSLFSKNSRRDPTAEKKVNKLRDIIKEQMKARAESHHVTDVQSDEEDENVANSSSADAAVPNSNQI